MSKQKLFDFVAKSIIDQGRKSVNPLDRCAYRGMGGCKCAIGLLISDEDYDSDLDTYSISMKAAAEDGPGKYPTASQFRDLAIRTANKIADEWDVDVDFLCLLQEAHDRSGYDSFFPEFFIDDFRDRMVDEVALGGLILGAAGA